MNCKWTLEVVGYREENPSGLKKFYPGTHYFQSREEVEEFANELTNPTGNVKPKQNSGTRYLGCSGNVPIFSDNFSASGANNKFWQDGISKMVYRVVPFQETAA